MRSAPVLGPAQQSELVRLVRSGMSQRAVARRFGISPPTVRKYLDAAPPCAPAEPAGFLSRVAAVARGEAVPPHEPPPAPPHVDPDAPALEIARALLEESSRALESARRVGDHSSAQRSVRDASGLAVLIARLEREQKPGDLFEYSISDVEAACDSLLEKYRSIPSDRCAHCGRALRVEQSGADADEVDGGDEV